MTQRASWLHFLIESHGDAQALTPKIRQTLADLDNMLFDAWNLGDNIFLAWTRDHAEHRFLSIRHYALIESLGPDGATAGDAGANDAFINRILSSSKFVTPPQFERICEAIGSAAQVLRVKLLAPEAPVPAVVTRLVTRYGVSLVSERAVVLLDIVGFSLRSPLEQMAMLNSVSYSVNSAYRKLLSKDIQISFARTTTGDGFYIWNRAKTVQANLALYKLMMLILADNAVAHRKAKTFPVPRLRAAFHIGEHYEFYQVEALNPTTFAYIVGHVTIELARMIGKALPGQIVIGDFNIDLHDEKTDQTLRYGTRDFVDKTAETLDELAGLAVGSQQIEKIRCYLTGQSAADGSFRVNQYKIQDKHGLDRIVYNAKINLHRTQAEPIFLGIQHTDLHRPGPATTEWCEAAAAGAD
jgi:hypothetical protein